MWPNTARRHVSMYHSYTYTSSSWYPLQPCQSLASLTNSSKIWQFFMLYPLKFKNIGLVYLIKKWLSRCQTQVRGFNIMQIYLRVCVSVAYMLTKWIVLLYYHPLLCMSICEAVYNSGWWFIIIYCDICKVAMIIIMRSWVLCDIAR